VRIPRADVALIGEVGRGPTGVLHVNEQTLFAEALERTDPQERAAFLDQACQGDAALRQRIERLLAQHEHAGSFLEPPVQAPAATIDEPNTEQPGTVIGPYKLVEEIGEGGMGTVYMAQQTVPVKRLVALKVIKPGMDSKQVLARFEAERQALALMDHPNIAKVHDAGTTPDGRPFFVMELVKGVPITRYCDDHRLTPKQRLELFVPVCQAIQHAHQKGIIHRDIKPSNVLVARYDGQPVPKVIDFGIAKATGQQLTEHTLVTGFGVVVGTLEYMSPEQAELNQLDIDTRSDIYSLGVLLYELLTGSTPLEKKRLKEAAMLEVLRLIREEEPPRPSMRLSSTDELPSVAAKRGLEPRKLSGLVRGELDWIAMKALEKDRNRRYETANGLAQDIQRYLADEPVQACPPSAWYRLRKFARRNKTILTTTAFVATLLVCGIVVSTSLMIRAITAESEASRNLLQAQTETQEKIREQRRAEANFWKAIEAVDQLLMEVGQDHLANLAYFEPVRRKLLEHASGFFEELLKQKPDNPTVRLETGMAWSRLGAIRHGLGDDALAGEAYQHALALLTTVARSSADDRPETAALCRRELANTQRLLGGMLWQQGRLADAEQPFQKARELAQRLADESPEVMYYQVLLGKTLHDLALLRRDQGRTAEARPLLEQAVRQDRTALKQNPKNPLARDSLARSLANLATVLRLLKAPDAEDGYNQALAIAEELAAQYPYSPNYQSALGSALSAYSIALRERGQLDKALQAAERAIERQQAALQVVPGNAWYRERLGYHYQNLAPTLGRLKGPAVAADTFLRSIALFEELEREFPAQVKYQAALAEAYYDRATWLARIPRYAEAVPVFRRAVSRYQDLANRFPTNPIYHGWLGAALNNLALELMRRQDWVEARQLLEIAIAHQQEALKESPQNPTYVQFLANHCGNLAEVCARQGEHARAVQAVEKILDLTPADWKIRLQAAFCLKRCAALAANNPGRPASEQESSVHIYHDRIGVLFLEAAQRNPDDPAAQNVIAWFLATCPDAKYRDAGRAVKLAKEATLKAPKNGDFWNTLGVAHYRVGAIPASLAAFEQSMRLRKGGDASDWFFLAMAHEKLGNRDQARKWHGQAMRWLEKNDRTLEQEQADELRRFQTEADELLKIEGKLKPK
jgi:serine/threonine protein kinase/Flp pilus assembly protein TadD